MIVIRPNTAGIEPDVHGYNVYEHTDGMIIIFVCYHHRVVTR